MSTALSASQHLPAITSEEPCPDWKRQLAERLDAYRAKRPEAMSPPSSRSNPHADSRASKIARSVASRYAAAPTYSELLLAAAQAEQAAAEAQAALAERLAEDARIAREKIEQVQAAQERMAAECNHVSPGSAAHAQPVMPRFTERTREMHLHQPAPEPEPSLEDLLSSALVEPRALLPSKLIEFPRELVSAHRAKLRAPEIPVAEPEFVMPEPAQLRIFEVQPGELPDTATPLPESGPQSAPEVGIYRAANEAAAGKTAENAPQTLPQAATEASYRSSTADRLESSRRNAAPKEGSSISAPGNGIHRAGAARSATSPANGSASAARELRSSSARAHQGLEWAAISLDNEPGALKPQESRNSVADFVPFLADPASIDRRLMAFAVDFAAVTAGFLAFLVVFVASTPHLPTGLTAVALGGAVYAFLWLVYQALFFSFSGATAGMLYARIALCTFDDRNPTRSDMRLRLAAWWLSCLPLGIGFLWCFVDEDNLSWHDRMTRIYQRVY